MLHCPELETTNAMKRRALAFVVKACGFHAMNRYHADLFDHLHQAPPPGYAGVSLARILRADRAAWLHIAEKITTLKRDEHGSLLGDRVNKSIDEPPFASSSNEPKRSRSPSRQTTMPSATKGPLPPKEKAKERRGRQRKEGDQTFPRICLARTSRPLALDPVCYTP